MRPERNEAQATDINEPFKTNVDDANFFVLKADFTASQAYGSTTGATVPNLHSIMHHQNSAIFPDPEVLFFLAK